MYKTLTPPPPPTPLNLKQAQQNNTKKRTCIQHPTVQQCILVTLITKFAIHLSLK